jgi:hypothetical protein
MRCAMSCHGRRCRRHVPLTMHVSSIHRLKRVEMPTCCTKKLGSQLWGRNRQAAGRHTAVRTHIDSRKRVHRHQQRALCWHELGSTRSL